jgi:hypothetical protein
MVAGGFGVGTLQVGNKVFAQLPGQTHIGSVPNQRSKDKVRLGGFVDRDLYRAVLAFAKREGMAEDKFGFAQKLISEALDRREPRSRARLSQGKSAREKPA